MTVDPSGAVRSVDANDQIPVAIARCVAEALRDARFPPGPGGTISVFYPPP